jgi:hypothetical protein
MPELFLLPELARSLRTFGAPRDAAGEAAHAAIFTPLLDARAHAAAGGLERALSALRGEALAARISAGVSEAAHDTEADPAWARGRSARARELLEPLRAELALLDRLAVRLRDTGATSPERDAWVAQLRRVFTSADDACRGLACLLGEAASPRAGRRWFGRGGR